MGYRFKARRNTSFAILDWEPPTKSKQISGSKFVSDTAAAIKID